MSLLLSTPHGEDPLTSTHLHLHHHHHHTTSTITIITTTIIVSTTVVTTSTPSLHSSFYLHQANPSPAHQQPPPPPPSTASTSVTSSISTTLRPPPPHLPTFRGRGRRAATRGYPGRVLRRTENSGTERTLLHFRGSSAGSPFSHLTILPS